MDFLEANDNGNFIHGTSELNTLFTMYGEMKTLSVKLLADIARRHQSYHGMQIGK